MNQPNEVAPNTPTCGPFGENLVYTRSNGQVVNGTRAPFGNDFSTDVYFDGLGNSVYNSLQVSVKHSARGLSILGSYTYGKSLDLASNLGEQVYLYDYKLTRALSSFDIRQNFVASYRYDMPFDKLFRHDNRLTKGWAISGITRFSSGLPVTLINPNDTALRGSFNNGVNGNGFSDLDLSPGSLEINHNPRNGQPAFNTFLFCVPGAPNCPEPLGSPGNASRRYFYGPGLNNWDMALLKDTSLTESKTLEFRLETFNTFNHAQFFGANSVDGNINDTTFGQVLSAMPPRLMQAALRLRFDKHEKSIVVAEPHGGRLRDRASVASRGTSPLPDCQPLPSFTGHGSLITDHSQKEKAPQRERHGARNTNRNKLERSTEPGIWTRTTKN